MTQFDEHYKGLEPIDIMEKNARRMLVAGCDVKTIVCVSMALKYLLRCGSKAGEPVEKDLQKAMNYTFRGIHKKWEWEK